jgi:dTDP-4-amino-4,6-dideoxygalactose transaminase
MYRPGTMQCLSFGHTKPLHIGHGGAILLDDKKAYETILCQRYDGRDLTVAPWQDQKTFHVGYHYKPSIEDAIQGVALLQGVKEHNPKPVYVPYPDLRNIKIVDDLV